MKTRTLYRCARPLGITRAVVAGTQRARFEERCLGPFVTAFFDGSLFPGHLRWVSLRATPDGRELVLGLPENAGDDSDLIITALLASLKGNDLVLARRVLFAIHPSRALGEVVLAGLGTAP